MRPLLNQAPQGAGRASLPNSAELYCPNHRTPGTTHQPPKITGPRGTNSAQLSATLTWSPARGHGLSLPALGTKMSTKSLPLIQSTDITHLSFSLLSNRLLSSQQLQASRNPEQKVRSCHGPCQPPHCPSCGHPALVTGVGCTLVTALGPTATLLLTTTATL